MYLYQVPVLQLEEAPPRFALQPKTKKNTNKDTTKKDEGASVKSGQGKSKKRDSSTFFSNIADDLDGSVVCEKKRTMVVLLRIVFGFPQRRCGGSIPAPHLEECRNFVGTV